MNKYHKDKYINHTKWTLERSDGRKKEYIKKADHWVAVVYDIDAMGARKDLQAIVDGEIIWSII